MSESRQIQIDQKVLEESRERFVWQMTHGKYVLAFAFMIIFLLAIPIGGIIMVMPEAAGVWKKILIAIACLVPPTVVIGMLQIVGYKETWIFDRVQQKITIKVCRFFGEGLLVCPYEQVKRIYLETDTDEDTDPEEHYHVGIEAQPYCNLRGSPKYDRVVYTSSDQNQAQAWAKKLQYYCNFHEI